MYCSRNRADPACSEANQRFTAGQQLRPYYCRGCFSAGRQTCLSANPATASLSPFSAMTNSSAEGGGPPDSFHALPCLVFPRVAFTDRKPGIRALYQNPLYPTADFSIFQLSNLANFAAAGLKPGTACGISSGRVRCRYWKTENESDFAERLPGDGHRVPRRSPASTI